MSETSNQGTSILLPPASVAIYSTDHETLQAARDLAHDWRFARIKLLVDEGDVITAANSLKDIGSPDLVIVQTDTIDESFAGKLEALAANCDEGTAAIVIGPVNDVYLYRKIIDMGVSDYLVRPVSKEILSEVVARTLIERIGVTGSKLIAFIGAKGGVGVSTMAQATAWAASDLLGHKTLILDSSGGWSTLSVGMGFEPSTTLAEAARAASNNDEDSIKRMLFKASDKLHVLASGGDSMLEMPVEPEQLEELMTTLMVTYPVVIADLSHASEKLANITITKASQVVVVSTPTLTSLRLARSLIQEIKDLRGGSDAGIEMIVNMQGIAPKNEVDKKDIEQAMEFKVSSLVPFQPGVFIGLESSGKKLLGDDNGKSIVHASILPILKNIVSGDVPVSEEGQSSKGGFLDGLFKKIKK